MLLLLLRLRAMYRTPVRVATVQMSQHRLLLLLLVLLLGSCVSEVAALASDHDNRCDPHMLHSGQNGNLICSATPRACWLTAVCSFKQQIARGAELAVCSRQRLLECSSFLDNCWWFSVSLSHAWDVMSQHILLHQQHLLQQ